MDAMLPSCQFRLDEGVKLTLDSDKVTERFKSCAVVVCAEQIGIIKVVKRIEARKRKTSSHGGEGKARMQGSE